MYPGTPYPAPRNPKHGSSCCCADCLRHAQGLEAYRESARRCAAFNDAQRKIEDERHAKEMERIRSERQRAPWYARVLDWF